MAKHQQQIDIYYHLSDVSSFKIPEEMRPHRNSAARFIQSIAGTSNSTRALSALSTGPPHRTATRSLSTGQAECWPLWALKELEGDKNKTKLWKPPSTCSRCRCHTLRPPRKWDINAKASDSPLDERRILGQWIVMLGRKKKKKRLRAARTWRTFQPRSLAQFHRLGIPHRNASWYLGPTNDPSIPVIHDGCPWQTSWQWQYFYVHSTDDFSEWGLLFWPQGGWPSRNPSWWLWMLSAKY